MKKFHMLKVFIFVGLASIVGLGTLLAYEEPRTREEQKIAVWINQLADKDPKVREDAASSLEEFAYRNVFLYTIPVNKTQVEKLLQALNDPNPKVRMGVIVFLSDLGGRDIAEKVKLKLKDEDAEVRLTAARALTDLRPLGDIGSLIAAADDENEEVRGVVATALGESKYPEAYQVVLRLSQDEDQFVRYCALLALGEYGDKRAEPILIALLNDPDPEIRSAAASALRYIGGKKSIRPLIEMFRQKDEENWAVSLHETVDLALTQITLKEYGYGYEWWDDWWKENKDTFDPVERVREVLRSEASEIELEPAFRRIGFYRMTEFKPELRNMLSESEGDKSIGGMARLSATTLAEWGEFDGLAYLFSALKDAHPKIRPFLMYDLRELTGQFFYGDHEAWLKWWEENKSRIHWNEKHHIFEVIEEERG